MQKKKLTPKQKKFCQEYMIDLNATQAAIRAGYSKKTSHAIGQENLKKPIIVHFLNNKLKEQEKRTEITADRVIKELAKIAFIDITKIFDENGFLLPIHELPPEVAAAISSVEITSSARQSDDDDDPEYLKKVKLWDKKGALELLGKHFKIFTEVFEGKVQHGLHPEFEDKNDEQFMELLKARGFN